MVTNEQIYLAIGVPMLFNATLIGVVLAYMNAKFDGVNDRLAHMQEMWRSELGRVEGVFDARLKHLEER